MDASVLAAAYLHPWRLPPRLARRYQPIGLFVVAAFVLL